MVARECCTGAAGVGIVVPQARAIGGDGRRPVTGLTGAPGTAFLRDDEDGSARASMNFKVETLGDGRTLLSTETRVRCFGAGRRRFKIYWTLIGPFSAWIRRDWLRSIKRRGEAEITSKKLT